MSWNKEWSPQPPLSQKELWDKLTRDELLTKHLTIKDEIERLKVQEMNLRKYIVDRAFPDKHEGTNTQELGNGYQLKAKVKYSYKITAPAHEVWAALERIRKIGNKGSFIADRLVSWAPSFLLTEYRPLVEDKDESPEAAAILKEISTFLTIEEAAPELEIKEPKGKK